MELAEDAVRVPTTGYPNNDLRTFAAEVADFLRSPETIRLVAALAVARTEDAELQELAATFWRTRFDAVAPLLRDASSDRSVSPERIDRAIETVIAPLYFRALVSGQSIDDRLVEDSIATALTTLASR
jgi:hypothetical protein